MKLNLIIDASGLFYRSLFTLGNYGEKKDSKLLESPKSKGMFMRKLASDFSTIVKNIEEPCRVIVCLDSTSWRKSIEIKDGAYKGDREQSDSVNWNAFFELTEKFSKLLGQKGYIISKVPLAEADDLLYFWSKRLNDLKENAILITGDRDLLQVIKRHENGSWTIAIDPVNSRRKVSLTQDTFDNINNSDSESYDVDIFDSSSWSSSKDILQKITNNYDVNIVNPRKMSFEKVILGDGGDAVPPILTWKETDKTLSVKNKKMTKSNFDKVVSENMILHESSWQELREGKYVDEIIASMEKLKKLKINKEALQANIERNCILVILDETTIPKQVFDNYYDIHKGEIPDILPITGRDALLNGTEWWSADKNEYVPKAFDLFD